MYTKADFIADAMVRKNRNWHFIQEYRMLDKNWVYVKKATNMSDLFINILKVNQYTRASSKSYSIYRLHKAYPSARSFYKAKLWISLGNGMAMTMNDIDNTFGVYYYDIFHDINQDRIILMSEEIDDENYGSIHNTLTILELGHMVYNLHYICSCFNSSIRIQIKSRYVLVDLVEDEQVKREIKKYNQLAQLRSSGSYSNKLINFSLDHSAYRYVSVIDRKKVFKQLFNQELNDVIEVLEFINTGICFWNEEYDIQISFEELNAQYDFVDFKSATQYTLFLINKEYISTKLLKKLHIIHWLFSARNLF